MATLPNMTLNQFVIGATYDPQWEQYLVANTTILDAHNHNGAGNGAKVSFNNLDFAVTPNLGGRPLTGVKYLQTTQTALGSFQAPSAGVGVLQVDTTGNLYYTSPTTRVQLSSSTTISSAGGFTGQYNGSASAYYSANQSSNAGGLTYPYTAPAYYFFTTATPTLGVSGLAALYGSSLYLIGSFPGAQFNDTNTYPNNAFTLGILGSTPAQNALERFGLTWAPASPNVGVQTTRAAPFALGLDGSLIVGASPGSGVGGQASQIDLQPAGFHINELPIKSSGGLPFYIGTDPTTYPFTVLSGTSNGSTGMTGYFKTVNTTANGLGGTTAVTQFFGSQFEYRVQSGPGVVSGAGGYVATYQTPRLAYHQWYWNNNPTVAPFLAYGTNIFNVLGGVTAATGAGGTNYSAVDMSTTDAGLQLGLGNSVNGIAGNHAGNTFTGTWGTPGTGAATGVFVGLPLFADRVIPVLSSGGTAGFGASTLGTAGVPYTTAFVTTATIPTLVGPTTVTTGGLIPAFSSAAPTSSHAGGLFQNNQVIAWGYVSATGILTSSYNVAGVSVGGTSTYTVTFSSPLSAGNYAAVASITGGVGTVFPSAKTANTIVFTTFSDVGATAAQRQFDFIIVGTP
jgi:hypothetical protein